MIEAMKQMQEALREYHYYTIDAGLPNQSMLNKGYAAFQAGKQAISELEQRSIAELESQEPVGALTLGGIIDTSDGLEYEGWDVEWDAKVIEALQEKLVTSDSVEVMLYTHPPQRTEQNFCSRCGKRTKDLTHIHTCTPPQDNS